MTRSKRKSSATFVPATRSTMSPVTASPSAMSPPPITNPVTSVTVSTTVTQQPTSATGASSSSVSSPIPAINTTNTALPIPMNTGTKRPATGSTVNPGHAKRRSLDRNLTQTQFLYDPRRMRNASVQTEPTNQPRPMSFVFNLGTERLEVTGNLEVTRRSRVQRTEEDVRTGRQDESGQGQ